MSSGKFLWVGVPRKSYLEGRRRFVLQDLFHLNIMLPYTRKRLIIDLHFYHKLDYSEVAGMQNMYHRKLMASTAVVRLYRDGHQTILRLFAFPLAICTQWNIVDNSHLVWDNHGSGRWTCVYGSNQLTSFWNLQTDAFENLSPKYLSVSTQLI